MVTPQSVASAEAVNPTSRLVTTAPLSASFSASARYQASVKPLSGKAAWMASLNENNGIRQTGR